MKITNIAVETIECPIVVSTWQSAVKQKEEWFEQFGMLINDECHTADAKSITKVNNNLTKCVYKIGMTGSLKDGKTHAMQYTGLFGSVFRPVTTKQLMDEGKVTNLKIFPLFLRYPTELVNKLQGLDYQKEVKFITNYNPRNKFIINLAKRLADKNENVFVMFRHVEHGTKLKEELEKIHDKVAYIDGSVKTDTRNELKKDLENETGVITVASYGVFSTGISIKNLHHVIFAHPVKGKITVIQSIGRILRKHKSKNIAMLWDVIDDFGKLTKSANAKNKYSKKNYALEHGLGRIEKYIDEEFDFKIKNIELR